MCSPAHPPPRSPALSLDDELCFPIAGHSAVGRAIPTVSDATDVANSTTAIDASREAELGHSAVGRAIPTVSDVTDVAYLTPPLLPAGLTLFLIFSFL